MQNQTQSSGGNEITSVIKLLAELMNKKDSSHGSGEYAFGIGQFLNDRYGFDIKTYGYIDDKPWGEFYPQYQRDFGLDLLQDKIGSSSTTFLNFLEEPLSTLQRFNEILTYPYGSGKTSNDEIIFKNARNQFYKDLIDHYENDDIKLALMRSFIDPEFKEGIEEQYPQLKILNQNIEKLELLDVGLKSEYYKLLNSPESESQSESDLLEKLNDKRIPSGSKHFENPEELKNALRLDNILFNISRYYRHDEDGFDHYMNLITNKDNNFQPISKGDQVLSNGLESATTSRVEPVMENEWRADTVSADRGVFANRGMDSRPTGDLLTDDLHQFQRWSFYLLARPTGDLQTDDLLGPIMTPSRPQPIDNESRIIISSAPSAPTASPSPHYGLDANFTGKMSDRVSRSS